LDTQASGVLLGVGAQAEYIADRIASYGRQ
jgi:hypothetical protein